MEEIDRLLKVAEDELSYAQNQVKFIIDQIVSLRREREDLLHPTVEESPAQYWSVPVTNHSGEEAKITLFRSLFRGREDVYARRFESKTTGKSGYQPDCENEWRTGICQKPKIKCVRCDQRRFVPLTDAVIRGHLKGRKPTEFDGRDFTIGLYPMLTDETCWFLVAATGFGKTVVAAWLIARRGVNTVVLVHTRQLMDQWLSRLKQLVCAARGIPPI